MRKIFSLILLFLIIGIGTYLIYINYFSESLKYITIDINPSVQLSLNEGDEVVEVLALNEDADIILSDIEIEGLGINEAVDLIIDSATESGYIDELSEDNVVTVTGYDLNEKANDGIQNKVKKRIEEKLERKGIFGEVVVAVMTDELKNEAKQYEISNGKMLLIQKAYIVDNNLDKEELANMTIKEIQTRIKESVKERYKDKGIDLDKIKSNFKEAKQEKIKEAVKNVEKKVDEIISEEANYDTLNKEEQKELRQDYIEKKKEEIKNKIQVRRNKKDLNVNPSSIE